MDILFKKSTIKHGLSVLLSITCLFTINAQCSGDVLTIEKSDWCGLNDVTLLAKVNGGFCGTCTYNWNGDTSTSQYWLNSQTSGTYKVVITDTSGCVDSVSVSVTDTACCPGIGFSYGENDSCDKNGTDVFMLLDSSFANCPSCTYLWSNGDTTKSANDLQTGTYSFIVTKTSPILCIDTIQISVVDDTCVTFCQQLANQARITKKDGCKTNDGELEVFAKGIYSWSTGSTAKRIVGLSIGVYLVTVVDIGNNCTYTLTDSITKDSTYRCCKANFDINPMLPIGDYILNATSISLDSISNYNWSFGDGTFGTSKSATKSYPLLTYKTICHWIQDTASCKDTICKTVYIPNSGKNHKVSHFGSAFSQQRTKWTGIYYTNKGLVTDSATIVYKIPAGCSVVSSSIAATSVVGNTYTYKIGTLNPGTFGTIYLDVNVPLTYSLGTTLCDTTYILTTTNDIDTSDNVSYNCQSVVNSYDPNMKSVSPTGVDIDHKIDTTVKEINNRIDFQNLGNDRTYNVRVEDTIDSAVYLINTLSMDYSSHPYRMVVNGNKIIWYFDNLQLTPKTQNEDSSKGFVTFSMRLKGSLPHKTKIQNKAEIFFDFNPAIITNTVLNTIFIPCDSIQASFVISDSNNRTVGLKYTGSKVDTIIYNWGDGNLTVIADTASMAAEKSYTYSTIVGDSLLITVTAINRCGESRSYTVWHKFCKPELKITKKEFCGSAIYLKVLKDSSLTFVSWSTGSKLDSIQIDTTNYASATYVKKNGCSFKDSFEATKLNEPTLIKQTMVLDCKASPLVLNSTRAGIKAYRWNNGSTASFIQVSKSGTYQVTITHQCGFYRDTFIVKDSIRDVMDSLKVIACDKYLWRDSSYTKSGKYTRTFFSNFRCDTILTLDLKIGLNPAVQVMNGNTYVVKDSFSSYQWYSCNPWKIIQNEKQRAFVTSTKGRYAVAVSLNTCRDTSDCADASSGLAGTISNQINLYPNPVSDVLYIDLPASYRGSSAVSVVNMLGKSFYNQVSMKTNVQIDMKHWASAVYFIQISNGDKLLLKKVVKE